MSRKLSDFEKQLNKIRIKMYNDTKDMTSSEIVEFMRKKTEPIIKKYGFKTVSLEEIRARRAEEQNEIISYDIEEDDDEDYLPAFADTDVVYQSRKK